MSLWNRTTRSFDGPMLHCALIARGYTVDAFAEDARVKRWTLYNALKGRRIRDETAIKIFKALENRTPMPVVYEGVQFA